MNDIATLNLFSDLLDRLRKSLAWVAAQFWATLLLFLAGVAWTRLPDKHAWQVVLSLVVPLLLLALLLLLEAGTMRRLFNHEQGRVPLTLGAALLLVWVVVVWLAWWILDWCGDQIPLWAGYLNSRVDSNGRATLFTYDHLTLWLTALVWIFRWIVVPAKVIPLALASVQWGWRLPLRKVIRLLLNWRWWIAVVAASLLAVELPSRFFIAQPSGSVSHQIWAIVLKIAGLYLLAVIAWVLLLAWAAVLLYRQPDPAEDSLDRQLYHRLSKGRWWLAGIAVWVLILGVLSPLLMHLPAGLRTSIWFNWLLAILFLVSFLFLLAALLRSMIGLAEKRARILWSILMMVVWMLLVLIASYLLSLVHIPSVLLVLLWFVFPGIFFPLLAASAQWGVRLPWRKLFGVLLEWRWWLGVFGAVIVGVALPALLSPASNGSTDTATPDLLAMRRGISIFLLWSSSIVLSAWVVVLFFRARPAAPPASDALVPAVVGSGPLGEDSVKLPLPESSDDTAGQP